MSWRSKADTVPILTELAVYWGVGKETLNIKLYK